MFFDDQYKQAETVWGEKPDTLLIDILPFMPKGRVLDLGMGEGRNALFFATRGYDVKGVDISPTAVEKCRQRAETSGVSIQTEAADLLQVEIEPGSLALVICAMSLQFVKKSESEIVMRRIIEGLQAGGLVYITVFSTDDPGYQRAKSALPEVEPNTFYIERMNSPVHYFEKETLLTPFSDLTLIHFAQTTFLDRGHPGVPDPHYHGILTYIGQR